MGAYGGTEQASKSLAYDYQTMTLNSGWDLVSVCGEPVNAACDVIFPPDKVIAVWEYSNPGGYSLPAEIKPHKGYWVKATAATTLIIPLKSP